MKNTILTILNILAALPIALYPGILIAGIMALAAPGAMRSVLGWVLFLSSTLYPAAIILLIIFSRKYQSAPLAFLSLIPLIFIVYMFFAYGSTDHKDGFNTMPRDFSCGSNSFLSFTEKGQAISGLELFEKRYGFAYKRNSVARIYGDTWILPNRIGHVSIQKRIDSLLASCKDNDGKSPIDRYTVISKDEVRGILDSL